MNKRAFFIGGMVIAALIAIFAIYHIIVNIGKGVSAPAVKTEETQGLSSKIQKLITKGDDDAAIKELESSLALDPDSPKQEAGYFSLAAILDRRNDLIKARELYQKIIEKYPSSSDIMKTQEALDNVNMRILFSPVITPDSFAYEVQKGDTLARIAKKFNTTIELISKANNIKGSVIRIGKSLKISKAKFSIVVDKSQNILTLKSDESILKTYKVSTGQNFSTPTGTFKITAKIVDPTWYTAGAITPPNSPQNILGTRWLGISKEGYGIHGTTKPQSIGRQVTAGCVRMSNSDVEELYSIVPEGTEVIIVD